MNKHLELYESMLRILEFENRVAELIESKQIKCPCHLYSGQEAISVGVCENLSDKDTVYSTHRSHGHYLAKGGDINALMAELFGKKTGCSGGKGGSMHICDDSHGLPGSSAIVGGTIPLAVGAALANRIMNKNHIVVCFFGDGATNEGVYYESLNFAKLNNLPIIFVCENNNYSTHMHIKKCVAVNDICSIPEAMGIESCKIDGNDVLKVDGIFKLLSNFVKRGNGPYFVECKTYRHRGHVGPNFDTDKGIRSPEELNEWMLNDPIDNLIEYISGNNKGCDLRLKAIKLKVENEIDNSIEFAMESQYPGKEELLKDVYKEV